ncbi:MAG TPA: radical SAM protein, partial [Vicinamibacterales bacterium]|nr:radical SAM protein [Vicinamibacterales bacterium]
MMPKTSGLRCRHAFEALTVHANGEVVCSIIDGRGDFVLGNVHHETLQEIFTGPRIRELRRLVLSSKDQFCPAIGKHCPLKNIATTSDEQIATSLRYLMIEPTTACDLRCLTCPVRDFSADVTWRDAYRDGGMSFLAWDGLRRAKQQVADGLRRTLPKKLTTRTPDHGPLRSALFRGRVNKSRNGTLPIHVLKQVVTDAGPGVERIDLFNFGEPFLYRHLVEALRHIRKESPSTGITISTDGMQVRPEVEEVIVRERLLDWIVFSVDGIDEESYRRYRIRGRFEVA